MISYENDEKNLKQAIRGMYWCDVPLDHIDNFVYWNVTNRSCIRNWGERYREIDGHLNSLL